MACCIPGTNKWTLAIFCAPAASHQISCLCPVILAPSCHLTTPPGYSAVMQCLQERAPACTVLR